jgi:hypothetical protein
MEKDSFQLNIDGVTDLVNTGTNKVGDNLNEQEGVVSDEIDYLDLPMSDEELITLKKGWENVYAPYEGKLSPRQKQNKAYLSGTQKQSWSVLNNKTVPSNLLFEATATFVPQALAKNPEPVVFSDNTEEGKKSSNDIKTVLQFLAMTLGLRNKLRLMVWHWSTYFTAVMKYGWDKETNQISCEVRKPQNFLLDPDGYVDEFGDFKGWLGERIQSTAQELIDLFPSAKDALESDTKTGTQVVRTEWWTDKYSFTTYKDKVLEKHNNEFFNYQEDLPNHFGVPKKPYTFLSVFSMQEQPHDFTNLIEQNLSNQDRINQRDYQIEKNLKHGNNAIAVSDTGFTSETAHQAADALENGDPILVSGNIDQAIKRIPANSLPNGILDSQQIDKDTLRGIYGTQGLSAQPPDENTTARGMILNQSHDSSRIGGGMGDSLETVATSFFNWMLQLTYVFYDEKHYSAIMGQASAVEYVGMAMVGHERQYVVSVAPNSMQPKDELTQVNQTLELWKSQAIDPIGLFKGINDADPMQSAKRLVLWNTNPQLYALTYFPETAGQQPQDSANTENPLDNVNTVSSPEPNISQEPASASLSQVPL